MLKKNNINISDVIVIGAGSGGLSVGLFLAKVGIKVTMIVKSDKDVGGECLNDGCVPSKALIHVSKLWLRLNWHLISDYVFREKWI